MCTPCLGASARPVTHACHAHAGAGACAVVMILIRAGQGGQSWGIHGGGMRWRGWGCGATRKTAPLDGQEGRELIIPCQIGPSQLTDGNTARTAAGAGGCAHEPVASTIRMCTGGRWRAYLTGRIRRAGGGQLRHRVARGSSAAPTKTLKYRVLHRSPRSKAQKSGLCSGVLGTMGGRSRTGMVSVALRAALGRHLRWQGHNNIIVLIHVLL